MLGHVDAGGGASSEGWSHGGNGCLPHGRQSTWEPRQHIQRASESQQERLLSVIVVTQGWTICGSDSQTGPARLLLDARTALREPTSVQAGWRLGAV